MISTSVEGKARSFPHVRPTTKLCGSFRYEISLLMISTWKVKSDYFDLFFCLMLLVAEAL